MAAAALAYSDPAQYVEFATSNDEAISPNPQVQALAQRMRMVTQRLVQRAIALPTDPGFADRAVIHSSEQWPIEYGYTDPPSREQLDREINSLLDAGQEAIHERAKACIHWLWSRQSPDNEIVADPDSKSNPPVNTTASHAYARGTTMDPHSIDAKGKYKRASNRTPRTPATGARRSIHDLTRLYLDEIGSTPLLDDKDEIALALTIRKGKAAQLQLDTDPNIPESQSEALHAQIKDAEAARERFALSNMRLVIMIAKRFTKITHSMELSDLITSGYFGLENAVNKFDPDRGYRFSTMATWWIRQAIQRDIMKYDKNVRFPAQLIDAERFLFVRIEEFTHQYKRSPSDQELIEFTNGGVTQAMIDFVRSYDFSRTDSLDEPADTDDPDSPDRYTTIRQRHEDSVEQLAENFETNEIIAQAIKQANLTEEELTILTYKYGDMHIDPGVITFTLNSHEAYLYGVDPAAIKKRPTNIVIQRALGFKNQDRVRQLHKRAIKKITPYIELQ